MNNDEIIKAIEAIIKRGNDVEIRHVYFACCSAPFLFISVKPAKYSGFYITVVSEE